MTQDLEKLKEWIGQTESDIDYVTVPAVHRLAATLDRADPMPKMGDSLPAGWHQILFPRVVRHSQIGADGHPERGDFLPPVPLPHRMWAGGRLDFRRALRIGDEVERRSTIASVDAKQGRSGALVFVTVRHEIMDGQGVALTEEHDIVYRGDPAAGAVASPPAQAPVDEHFARAVVPDAVLLFRYSALTFNGHRIHYDRRYATEVEGYPGLVVHGPLIATLLVDLLRREAPDARLRAFTYRAASPLFDTHPFTACGRRESDHVALWARDHLDRLAMHARAELA